MIIRNLKCQNTNKIVCLLQVDCIVTTAGGIEEDLIKCLCPTYLGDFTLPGVKLRDVGINRIGNLLAPNSNYCKFEDWIMPILDQLLIEQVTEVSSYNLFNILNKYKLLIINRR